MRTYPIGVASISVAPTFNARIFNLTSNNEGSLNSGYAVTSNYHGLNVPMGANVVVTAMSTNHHVDYVLFIWKDPAGHIVWTEPINVFHNGTTYNGELVYYAISTQTRNSRRLGRSSQIL